MDELETNLVDVCERSCARFAERPLFGQKRNGTWIWTTYAQFHRLVDRCRSGMAAVYGIGAGDRVVMVADNRIEWAVAAYACYGLGATFVPVHFRHDQQLDRKEWELVLRESNAKLAFAPGVQLMSVLSELRARHDLAMHIVGFDLSPHDDRGWPTLLANGDAARGQVAGVHAPQADDVAELFFEDGGLRPRTHAEILSDARAAARTFHLGPEDRALSLSPWADAYAQMVEMHALFSAGGSVAIDTDPAHLLDELAEVHPTLFIGGPDVFLRIHDRITHAIDDQVGPLRSLIRAGLRGAIKRSHGEHLGTLEALEAGFDERIVFKRIRDAFGGRLRTVVNSGAPLAHEVSDVYDALGIQVVAASG